HPLIQLGTNAYAAPEHDELQVEERLQRGDGERHPARRRVEHHRGHLIAFLRESENITYRHGRSAALTAVSLHDGERAHFELEGTGSGRSLRSRVAPDRQIRDLSGRAACAPKQLAVDEKPETCPRSQSQKRCVAAAARATERLLAEHREVDVVLDLDAGPEAAAKVIEDIEVLQPLDVRSQGNPARERIDRTGYAYHDMTHARSLDADGLRQLEGAGRDLLGYVCAAAPVRGLRQLRDDPAVGIGHGGGQLGPAEVGCKAMGALACHRLGLLHAGRWQRQGRGEIRDAEELIMELVQGDGQGTHYPGTLAECAGADLHRARREP